MASTSTYTSFPSPTSQYSQLRYDVFLSFRGEDTRRNFTDHLYSALIRCNIKTFRDDEELRKGEEIAPELLQAIEESRIAIVVFSKTYADSRWCLEELVKIINCKEEREQKVIPVFYHVDPSEVRNQNGIYEEAFVRHEENADEEKKEKIRRWKTAMREAGNLAGYDVKDSYESDIIHNIIEEIRRIVPMVLDVNENIVGMDSRLETLISGLEIQSNDDVRMVGVYGLGGIGKTTIITALYNKISDQFRSISFLTNVREKCTKDSGLLKLQQQLLDDTLGVKRQLTLKNIHEGVKVIKDRLSSKKVLVFVDDIDDLRQLEHLVGKHCWFGHGSRIIITTRKKYLLAAHEVDYMYEVKKLKDVEALQLFCSYAFKQHLPEKGYRDLSKQLVRYADCLPLALKVLGSLLFGKGLNDWKSELKKLKEVPHMEITNVLKISYDGLDYTQKRIFLDIACLFKGSNVEAITKLLDASGFKAKSGINALVDRCFITISNDKEIEMHDLLSQMGKEIVYKECPNEPGKRSRLWRHMDVCQVLTENMGTETIEVMVLNRKCTTEQINFTSEAFKRMVRLRVLGLISYGIQLCEDFSFPSDHLTSLWWLGYSLASLPSNFHANSLVHLHLEDSNIKRLWEVNLCLKKLSRVVLCGSQQLIEIPKFSTMPNLERLILSGCASLESLPGDIHKAKQLSHLHCNGCSKLTNFPEIKSNIGKLADLRLDGTAIKGLPSSIELLKGLRDLCLKNCKNLESLPNSFCNLSSLTTLSLDGCSELMKLPDDLERMPCLETLSLKSVSCVLPSLSGLSRLKILYLDECNLAPGVIKRDNRLNALEELSLTNCDLNGGVLNKIFHLCSLKVLDLSGSIINTEEGAEILVGISKLSNLRALGLNHCEKLSQIPELPSTLRLLDAHSSNGTSLPPLHSLVNCLKSANQDLECKRSSDKVIMSTDSRYHGQGICIVVQGSSGIPDWLRNQKEGSCIGIELPKVWHENNDFLGVAICCVYVPLNKSEGIPETKSDSESDDSAHEPDQIESDKESAYNETDNEFDEESMNESDQDFIEFACLLTFGDGHDQSSPKFRQKLFFRTACKSYQHEEDSSEQMLVTLYPKAAVMEICGSNQFMSLEAEFFARCRNFEMLKCGLQPMYAYDSKDVDDASCFDCQMNVENRKLCLKGQSNPINQLLSTDQFAAAAVDTLCLRDCKNLESLPASIWDQFKSLKCLFCDNCSQLQNLPEILRNMENMRELHLNGTAIKELPSSIVHLSRLEVLNLANCQNLKSLPASIWDQLKSLKSLFFSNCSQLQNLPEILQNMENMRELHLSGTAIKGLPSSIVCLSRLEVLNLGNCQNLESLPTSIWDQLKSLKSLFCDKCSQLQHLPEILHNMENMRELHLNGTAIKELPSSIAHLCRLQVLILGKCQNLETLPESLCNLCFLEVLEVSYCPKLYKLPQKLGKLERLKCLFARRLNTMCSKSLSLSGLCSLNTLALSGSTLTRQYGGVTVSEICCMSSLQKLDLSHCNLDEDGIPREFWGLSSLVRLYLNGNHFRSIPTRINQLSKLRVLALSHCPRLKEIAELPSSLRVLDVHGCRLLETSSLLSSSLFKCFISAIQEELEFRRIDVDDQEPRSAGVCVFASRSSGIQKWIMAQRKGSEVVAWLPQDWYKDGDLLGFGLYSIYDPVVVDNHESKARGKMNGTYFKCDLTLLDNDEGCLEDDNQIKFSCNCPEVMWMIYYPKMAIQKKHRSSEWEWEQLKASFCGSLHGKARKVNECGIHFIYASHAHRHDPASSGKSLIPTIATFRPERRRNELTNYPHSTRFIEHRDDPPMNTTTQNVNNWSEPLINFLEWILCV